LKIIWNIKRILKEIFGIKSRVRPKKRKLGKYGQIEMDIFRRVIGERRRHKRSNISWDDNSYHIAQRRAREISHNFSHAGCPTGYGENITKIPLGRVRGLGFIKYRNLGRAFIRTWMTSEGHRVKYFGF
jgi:uncharacterized protein YkwD